MLNPGLGEAAEEGQVAALGADLDVTAARGRREPLVPRPQILPWPEDSLPRADAHRTFLMRKRPAWAGDFVDHHDEDLLAGAKSEDRSWKLEVNVDAIAANAIPAFRNFCFQLRVASNFQTSNFLQRYAAAASVMVSMVRATQQCGEGGSSRGSFCWCCREGLGQDILDAGQFEHRADDSAMALMPVPERARNQGEFLLPPNLPIASCGIVPPFSETWTMRRRASLVAFSTAAGTSFALP